MKLGKKAIAPAMIFFGIILGIVFIFGGAGIIKFLTTDKTPLIVGGFILFIILLSKRRK